MQMATLINNIRLRIGAILTLSVGISLLREHAAPSVFKATRSLSINYITYGLLLVLSLIPKKAAWATGILFQVVSVLNDIFCLVIGSIATLRCISSKQTGCIEFALQSILTLVLLVFVTLMDMYQTWNIYLCLRQKTFVSSASQRVRILFSWLLPFGWLVNIVSLSESNMSIWATPHLVIDPIMIMMARSREPLFLGVLCGLLVGADAIHYRLTSISLVKSATLVQLVLTLAGGVMLSFDLNEQTKESLTASTDLPVAQAIPKKIPKSIPVVVKEKPLRQRKSKKIQF